MAELKKIVDFLDEELKVDEIEDSSNNGLQVDGKKAIDKIAFAVDACQEVFEKAVDAGADMIIVHHGISWADSLKFLTDFNFSRVKTLIKNDVALYACHLPLDRHEKYGNNIRLAKLLDLKEVKEFGDYHGDTIGYMGKFESAVTADELKKILDEKLDTESLVLAFGKEKISTIGIVSGGGGSALGEAIEKADCFLTGEASHHLYHEAKEGKINMIIAGHYQTETLGVKALMPLLKEKFGVETIFIDVPTPI